MTAWTGILAEARADKTAYLAAGVLVTLLVARLVSRERHSHRALLFFFVANLAGVALGGWFRSMGSAFYAEIRLPVLVCEAIVIIDAVNALLFAVLLPKARLRAPRILQDVTFGVAVVVSTFVLATKIGFNLSGIIATSAVITAVLGFSLQDTLGNIMGGLALQMDSSVEVGDWVKVGDVTGKVTEIRWRYTALETRNWETAIIPNSVLMKSQVMVLGRREGQPVQLRRWIHFNVDFRSSPTDVIRVAEDALKGAAIPGVAAEPAPNCVLMDLHESYGQYALRYWLTDLPKDDPTDSLVRTWVYFALKRAGIPLSIPAQAVFVTEESKDRRIEKSERELAHMAEQLKRVELFARLSDAERSQLACSLHWAPFAKGEVLTRQDAIAHYLYLIIDGEVAVSIAPDQKGPMHEVARLGPGEFFGEMSLMTGARRTATVIALTDVKCYRLDKSAFEEIIKKRPEMAEYLAGILAKRRVGLQTVRENIDQAEHARRVQQQKVDILAKIREFFGLEIPI